MDTPATIAPDAPGRTAPRGGLAAFSLVEVTLALGIVAFAFVGVLGMIPTGLNAFRQSMNVSVGTQIADRIINEAQQTDFSVLTGGGSVPISPLSYGSVTPAPVLRYFDDQGNELVVPVNAIYQVNTQVTPITVTPYSGSAPAEASNTNLATVLIQIANNPGHRAIKADPTTPSLWNDSSVAITTYTGLVSRNK